MPDVPQNGKKAEMLSAESMPGLMLEEMRELRKEVERRVIELAKEMGSENRRIHERINSAETIIHRLAENGCAHAEGFHDIIKDQEERLRSTEKIQQRWIGIVVAANAVGVFIGAMFTLLGRPLWLYLVYRLGKGA